MFPWRQDRALLVPMLLGAVLRVIPMLVYIDKPCVRDECTYIDLAEEILAGNGMVGTHGWLWAPAYPALMAVHKAVFGYAGTVQITQLVVATWTIGVLGVLGARLYEPRAGRIAAWLYAINPTMIFYTTSMWSEILYGGLLLGGVLALAEAREGRRSWLPGVIVGLCVLFRGVATYLLPIFLVGILWDRWRSRAAWRQAGTAALAAVLTVAPYSAYISAKYGSFVVSDRTLGQMMWLGNNDFPPMTFDWGNGTLADRAYERVKSRGRPPCERTGNPVRKDQCETEAGIAWIAEHPQTFLERVPLRVSQLLTPHSFLTRHLRWGRWKGLPDWVDEVLVVSVAGLSLLTMVGGTVAYFARGRGWYAAVSGLVVLYHVAAIAVLAGLSRYRVPLEPLWLLHLGALLAAPGLSLRDGLRRGAWTVLGGIVTVVLVVLSLRFLPAGWPTWRLW